MNTYIIKVFYDPCCGIEEKSYTINADSVEHAQSLFYQQLDWEEGKFVNNITITMLR